jgi:hypothetical protein
VAEQWYRAVLAVISDGRTVTEGAAAIGLGDQLNWWVKERQQRVGRVRGADGKQSRIRAADLRQASGSRLDHSRNYGDVGKGRTRDNADGGRLGANTLSAVDGRYAPVRKAGTGRGAMRLRATQARRWPVAERRALPSQTLRGQLQIRNSASFDKPPSGQCSCVLLVEGERGLRWGRVL